MVILLPETGHFEAFEKSFNAQSVADIVNDLGHTQVTLTVPRFKFDSDFSLKDTLAGMGMPIAFSGGADFSGMTGNRALLISDVIHKAFVSVDESGTEAAAATVVIMRETAAPIQQANVTVDRPFIFLIRDINTEAILFIGRVLDPDA
jgi:serpin B